MCHATKVVMTHTTLAHTFCFHARVKTLDAAVRPCRHAVIRLRGRLSLMIRFNAPPVRFFAKCGIPDDILIGYIVMGGEQDVMVRVHGNALKHGLSGDEVAYAWENPIRCRQRNGTDDPPLWISIGSLPDGRFAELIGFMDIDGVWCVFHAMVPPTKKFKRELGWR